MKPGAPSLQSTRLLQQRRKRPRCEYYSFSFLANPRSTQDQHRDVRVRQHLLGLAAQEQALDAFAAM